MTGQLPAHAPTRMGRYEVLFRIASGGMAEVYAARVHGEAGFEKLVAIKRMLPSLADDPEFVSMFLDEGRLAANITSPNVVQTLDLGRDNEGGLYIAMELVVGVTLGRILKEAAKVRRAVPLGVAVELIAQTALGLHAAHLATTPLGDPLNIVHRDVSPQNILVGIDGRARLTDFGVARAKERSSSTEGGRIKGKFAYCPPEQLKGEDLDNRSDLFSLGVVAWEMLAGQRLFVADHPVATMERVMSMPILPLNQVRSKVPEPLATVVAKALKRNPDERYTNTADFAAALQQAALDTGIGKPSVPEISRFVKAAGGETLRRMRDNLQRAMRGSPVELSQDDLKVALPPSEPSDTVALKGVRSPPDMHPDGSGVDRIPSDLMVNSYRPPAPKRSKAMFVLAIVGVVAIALIAALVFSTGNNDEPEITQEPVAAQATEESTTVQAAETEDEAELETVEAELETAETDDDTTEETVLDDAPEDPSIAAADATHSAMRTPRQRSGRGMRSARNSDTERTESTMQTVATTTPMATETTGTQMTETQMTSTATPMTGMSSAMTGGLLGAGAFDGALQDRNRK